MAVYGYIRTSTLEQAEDDRASLPHQRRTISGGAQIIDKGDAVFFEDVGVSGSTALASRPEGSKLVAAMREGDTLIVAKLDRIFRSAADGLKVADDFKNKGVDLIILDIGLDPVNRNGVSRLFFTMMAAMAEFERVRINERTDEGRKNKKANGGHIGGLAPYGFKKIGIGRDAKLAPEPREQEVIAKAKLMHMNGDSLRAIIRALAREGYKSRSGDEFQATQIRRMVMEK